MKVALALLLLLACLDYGISQQLSETGELTGFSLPPATLLLAMIFLVAIGTWWRRGEWPRIGVAQLVVLTLLPIGLLGLSRQELPMMLKELIKIGEVFIAAWLIAQMVKGIRREALGTCMALIGVLLLVVGPGGALTAPYYHLGEARYAALIVFTLPFALARARRWLPTVDWLAGSLLVLIAAVRIANGGLLLAMLISVAVTAYMLRPRLAARLSPALVLALFVPLLLPGPSAWETLNTRYDDVHSKRLYLEYRAALKAPSLYPAGGGLGYYKETINLLRQYLPVLPHADDNKVPHESNNQYLVTLVEAGILGLGALLVVMLVGIWHAAMLTLEQRDDGESASSETSSAVLGAMIGLALAALFCTILSRGIGIWAGMLLGLAHQRVQLQAPTGRRLWLLAIPAATTLLLLIVSLAFNAQRDRLNEVTPIQHALQRVTGQAQPRQTAPRIITLTEGGQAAPRLLLEAEDFDFEAPMARIPANDASGNHALDIPVGSGKGSGRAVGMIELPTAGTYRLRARVFWRDGCGNSIGIETGGQLMQLSSSLYNQWHTLPARQLIEAESGPLMITIVNLEDGVMIDYVEIERVE